MINLSKLIDNIQNDKTLNGLPLNEQLTLQTYYYLAEVFDKKNVYSHNMVGNFWATFTDDNKVKHFIRIIYQPLSKPRYDVKFGFLDRNGKPSYGQPNVHYNLHPDEKIFNTHIHILLDVFIDELNFFEKSNTDELWLPATDYPRYRLYRIALTKFLDKSKFDLVEHSNTLIIKKRG